MTFPLGQMVIALRDRQPALPNRDVKVITGERYQVARVAVLKDRDFIGLADDAPGRWLPAQDFVEAPIAEMATTTSEEGVP